MLQLYNHPVYCEIFERWGYKYKHTSASYIDEAVYAKTIENSGTKQQVDVETCVMVSFITSVVFDDSPCQKHN